MTNWSNLQDRVNRAVIGVFGSEGVTLNGVAVQADFVEPSDIAHLDGVQAMMMAPQLQMVSSDVPDAPVGMPATADGRHWRVAESHPDGYGLTRLMLEIQR
jgi:hypothetical protein